MGVLIELSSHRKPGTEQEQTSRPVDLNYEDSHKILPFRQLGNHPRSDYTCDSWLEIYRALPGFNIPVEGETRRDIVTNVMRGWWRAAERLGDTDKLTLVKEALEELLGHKRSERAIAEFNKYNRNI